MCYITKESKNVHPNLRPARLSKRQIEYVPYNTEPDDINIDRTFTAHILDNDDKFWQIQ
jgi:hypothetical protein